MTDSWTSVVSGSRFSKAAIKLARCVGVVAALGVCAYLVAGLVQEQRRLGLVPAGLGVTQVLHAKQHAWGFGPGGNETGVVVFALPAGVAKEIEAQGMGYLANGPAGTSGHGQGQPHAWQPTPVLLEGSDENTHPVLSYELAPYLNRYGFGIDIDATVARQIEATMSKPGGFVAQARTGLLIVAPALQRVFYIHSG